MKIRKKNNITIFIGSLTNGGAERVASNLANFLDDSFQVTVLTLSNIPDEYKLKKNIRRFSLSKKSDPTFFLPKNILRLIRLRSFLKKNQEDAYIVFLPITTILLLFNRRIINAPIIVSERNDPKTRYEKSFIRRAVMRYYYPKADGFVFQTDLARDYYAKVIGNKGVVIPNAVNHVFMNNTNSESNERKNNSNKIVAVGRLNKAKNYDLLLKAFSLVTERHPNKTLHIYGRGPEKKRLLELTEQLNITNKVYFEGFKKNIERHIKGADLYVLSSNYEGMPNALIEALALGIPCISTDCSGGGPKYLIEDGYNGFLVKVNSEKELADRMNYVLSNEKIAHQIANNGKKIVEKLSPKIIYGQWESYIENVMKTQQRKSNEKF